MGIYFSCLKCRAVFNIKKTRCKCGAAVTGNTPYRIIVDYKNKRVQKDLPRDIGGLAKAKEIEFTLKKQLFDNKLNLKSEVKTYTLAEAFFIWFDDYKLRKGKTDDDYCAKREFWKFNSHIKNSELAAMKLNEITAGRVQKFISNIMNTKKLSKQSIKHILGLISMVFNKMSDLDYYEGKNPAQKISRSLGGVNNAKTNTLFENERNSLIEVLNSYPNQSVANLLRFLLFTGIRRGSAHKLRWEDVDFESHKIYLDKTKNGESIYLRICETAMETLINQQKYKSDKSDFVFPNDHGLQRNHHIPQFNYIKKLAGITKPFRVHDLRHQFASELVRRNVPLGVVQQLLGHKSLKMTERYSHYAPENFSDAFKKIDSIYGNSSGQHNTTIAAQTEPNNSDRILETEKVQPAPQKETVKKLNSKLETENEQPKTDNIIKYDFANRKLA